MLVTELSWRTAPFVTSSLLTESSRLIPIIGSFIAAPLSFGGTYYALKLVLDKMESAALEVIQSAAESAAGNEDSDDD